MGFYYGLGTCYGFIIDRKLYETLLIKRFVWLTQKWSIGIGQDKLLIMVPGSWKNLGGLDAQLSADDLKRGYVSLDEFLNVGWSRKDLDVQGPLRVQIDAMAAWCRVVAGPLVCSTCWCTLSVPPTSSYGPALPIVDDNLNEEASSETKAVVSTHDLRVAHCPSTEGTHADDLGFFSFSLPHQTQPIVAGVNEMD